jgi:hypothetical protein
LAAIAGVFYSILGNKYLLILSTAALFSVLHLSANFERSNNFQKRYLIYVHIIAKILIFVIAYFAITEKIVFVTGFLIVVGIFVFSLNASPGHIKVNKKKFHSNFLKSGILAVLTPFILRWPYFAAALSDGDRLSLNTIDILTTFSLLAFVPLQQVYKLREVNNDFDLGDNAKHDLKEMCWALCSIFGLIVIIFILNSYGFLRLIDRGLISQCMVISSLYMAYFSSRNALQILIFHRKLDAQVCLFWGLTTIFVSIISFGVWTILINVSYFMLFSFPCVAAMRQGGQHINKPMLIAASFVFLIGSIL